MSLQYVVKKRLTQRYVRVLECKDDDIHQKSNVITFNAWLINRSDLNESDYGIGDVYDKAVSGID